MKKSIQFELITPEKAAKYMEANKHNRPFKTALFEKYCGELIAHRFATNHQGIAFDETGALIDGQHRLSAIIKTRIPMEMAVARGLSTLTNGDPNNLTRDTIDCGKNRSVADQLSLNHNVTNANLTAAAASLVAVALTANTNKLIRTVGTSLVVLSIYGRAIEDILSTVGSSKVARRAPVVAALAICSKANFEHIDDFAAKLASGEGVKRGMPVYALREHLISRGVGSGTCERLWTIEMICNCFLHTIDGNELKQVKSGARGLDYMRSKQRKHAETIRAALSPLN